MATSHAARIGDTIPRLADPSVYPAAKQVFSASAVAWGAIFAGAAAAAALSLILLILGIGLGLSSVSPWAQDGISASTFGVTTIVWLTLTQIAASGIGGYLAGRLRTKWIEAHRDEVYFRDTAHGFLAWAVASLASAALLTSVIGSIVNGGLQAGATVAGGVAPVVTAVAPAVGSELAKDETGSPLLGYFIDALFRKPMNTATSAAVPAGSEPNPGSVTADPVSAVTPEVGRIFMNTMRTGPLTGDDLRYVGQLVAQRTGLPQTEAEKRVSDTYARAQAKLRDSEIAAKQAADTARKASAYAALWLFISLLAGAFIASFAATLGGRRRDA